MALIWTTDAQRDLFRLHAFLTAVDPQASLRVIDDLYAGAHQLLTFPEMGVQMGDFGPRDVRRLIVGDYELRYERTPTHTLVLHIWHVREDR